MQTIGILGKHTNHKIANTLNALIAGVLAKNKKVIVDENCKYFVDGYAVEYLPLDELKKSVDVLAVIGGDGSLLKAARLAAGHAPIIGINRGTVGFLADISPLELEKSIKELLEGHYTREKRSLVEAIVTKEDGSVKKAIALNDAVLFSGNIARMIKFDVLVNNEEIFSLRSDGIIVSTPTGSTAYGLSAGGPIVNPSLDALILVPLNPHTMSKRPIVLNGNDIIELRLQTDMQTKLCLDGQTTIELNKNDKIKIKKYSHQLELIHPNNYSYFNTLRNKLNWV